MKAAAADRRKTLQAWIAPVGDDPEAVSALAVARERLPDARGLTELRRRRIVELRGPLPPRAEVERLLRASTQFYNPHKEQCTVRSGVRTRAPLEKAQVAVLVWERDGGRQPTAEAWWRHETGHSVEVVEGVAWLFRFDRQTGAHERAEAIAVLRERRHGLLCNPHAQAMAVASHPIPLPWLPVAVAEAAPRGGAAVRRARRRT